MRVLVGLMGCEKNLRDGVHQLIRETWGADAAALCDLRFFVGEGDAGLLPDEVRVPAPDDKDRLLYKVVEMCRWAVSNGYDSMLKVNTSSYVNFAEVMRRDHQEYDYAGAAVGRLGERYSGTEAYGFIQGSASWLSRKSMEFVVADAVSFALHHKDAWMRWNGWIAPYLHSEDLWIAQVLTPHLHGLKVAIDQGYGNGPVTYWSQSNYVKCYKLEEWMRGLHDARPYEDRMRAVDARYPKGWQT